VRQVSGMETDFKAQVADRIAARRPEATELDWHAAVAGQGSGALVGCVRGIVTVCNGTRLPDTHHSSICKIGKTDIKGV